ncbi:tRNA (5-methylaminomethyl-2-thiouridine)(34)-methyltransferase MnmD [uncultured Sunxiuqinia sp.]|uniref:tRNA (5-methylaminomethyl-2-thiouridine)(34)-methyltransferase MnmD n=1 Tax=uncultured Sunxiuqinia sp. TaxID=1573825 RepID=UPI0030D9CDB4|tara:strand:- start:2049 stop:2711 length:663 start_codon:yes stop_codon:yes gene_type:complete
MKRIIELTEDGSHTLYLPELDEHFHSVHGAVQESMHVFINNGVNRCQQTEIHLLEVGFGTGLNALLTLLHRKEKVIHYYSLEKYPLTEEEFCQLNYAQNYSSETQALFLLMHKSRWEQQIEITPGFELTKLNCDLRTFDLSDLPAFDLVYFDAFAPGKQADMWTDAIFQKISRQCKPGAIITTYCAKGDIRRLLQKNGFAMQRLPGPPGKREMLYGEKDH